MPLHPDCRCMSLHPAKKIITKKHKESYIYATYQRTFLKQLLKKSFKPTKENPSTVEKMLIKLLTLFFYCFNQMEKLTTSVKNFLHIWLIWLQYMCKFMTTFSYLTRKGIPIGKTKLVWEASFRCFFFTHFAKLFISLVVTNSHPFTDCMFLSCQVGVSEWIHTL